MQDVTFENNKYSNPMSLSADNALENVTVTGNEGTNGRRASSFFHLPQRSTSLLSNVTSRNNDKGSLIAGHRVNLTVSGSVFANNDGRRSGVIRLSASSLAVSDSHFINNLCRCNGSAVSMSRGLSAAFSSCDFVANNGSGFGGSVYASRIQNISFASCRFAGSSGAYRSVGGAVYLEGDGSVMSGAVRKPQTAAFANCTIERSWAGDGAAVALLFWRGAIHFDSCRFDGNKEIKEVFDRRTLAYAASGAILVFKGNITRFTAKNCQFHRNKAKKGGALSFIATTGTFAIADSTFVRNRGSGPHWEEIGGGGILVDTQIPHWPPVPYPVQGQLYVEAEVNLTISHCTFESNRAESLGGALHVSGSHVHVILHSNTFYGNRAERGAAVSVIRIASFKTSGNSTFQNNSAALSGGAMYIQSTEGNIESCTFVFNKAQYGGGMSIDHHATIESSLFTNNEATKSGGALHINRHPSEELGHTYYAVHIEQCQFIANRGGDSGGAIQSYAEENLNIRQCTFKQNSAYMGGAISLFRELSLKRTWLISSSTLSKNHAYIGGRKWSAIQVFVDSCF